MVVGLIGCGGWGRHILRDLVTLGCEVPVVARSEGSRGRATKGGASLVVDDLESLPPVAGLVVATPTNTHADVLREALELGVPVKPLANDAGDARELAARAPDRLFVMDKWRYHPAVRELSSIAREERLGRVSGLRTVRVGWGNPHDDVDAVWVLAPHDLSIALEIMGEVPEPHAASAEELDGELVHLSALLHGHGWWQSLEVSARSPERMRRVALHCERGVATLSNAWDEHVVIARDRDGELVEERIDTPGELPLLAELRAFVEHLDGGPAPRSSAAEGAAIVSAIDELRVLAAQ